MKELTGWLGNQALPRSAFLTDGHTLLRKDGMAADVLKRLRAAGRDNPLDAVRTDEQIANVLARAEAECTVPISRPRVDKYYVERVRFEGSAVVVNPDKFALVRAAFPRCAVFANKFGSMVRFAKGGKTVAALMGLDLYGKFDAHGRPKNALAEATK